jgi:hypothetical protein
MCFCFPVMTADANSTTQAKKLGRFIKESLAVE